MVNMHVLGGTIEKEELLNFFSYIPAGTDEGGRLSDRRFCMLRQHHWSTVAGHRLNTCLVGSVKYMLHLEEVSD